MIADKLVEMARAGDSEVIKELAALRHLPDTFREWLTKMEADQHQDHRKAT